MSFGVCVWKADDPAGPIQAATPCAADSWVAKHDDRPETDASVGFSPRRPAGMARGSPYRETACQARTAGLLSLESNLRAPWRPRKGSTPEYGLGIRQPPFWNHRGWVVVDPPSLPPGMGRLG